MKQFVAVCFAIGLTPLFAQNSAAPTVASMYDRPLTSAEREIVPLAEAMPADKYNFAPTSGEFKTVRTFALQVRHIATVIYEVAAAAQQEKSSVETGKDENGSDNLRTKEQIVQYLKDAFAYAHKAARALTQDNGLQLVANPAAFGKGESPRASLVNIAIWHSYDHYGQMVVYARMNGIIPPASRPH